MFLATSKKPKHNKALTFTFGVLLLIGIIIFFIAKPKKVDEPEPTEIILEEPPTEHAIIGQSVEQRDIEVFTFGDGEKDLLFVGGIHGGYEWNSVLLAYEFIDYLTADPAAVPENLKIHIIPTLNPDGVYDVLSLEGRFSLADIPADVDSSGTGRFNANDVDLNRNFDCKWAPESTWRGQIVSAGTGPFSEPEAATLQQYVQKITPEAAVFWHSQANTVYASECHNGVIPETAKIMNLYATAAGYNSVEVFDAYEITGDAEGWLASIGIPAITVELKTHETVEFQQNLAGFNELLRFYESN